MSLTVTFTNNSTHPDSDVSIGFVAAPGSSFSASSGGVGLETLNASSGPGNWYPLSQLTQGVAIQSFSGRIYVAYGTPWAVSYPNYEPGQSVTDANFFLRYDKMEMTFTGQATDVADLTSIDYWSIPMSLQTSCDGGTPVQSVSGLANGATAQSVYTALAALTSPPVSGLTGPGGTDGTPLPAVVPGQFVQYPNGPAPGTSFARVIGPSSYASITPPGIPVQPYDTLRTYLDYLIATFGPGTTADAVIPTLGNGVIAHIGGTFAGVGPNPPPNSPLSPQSYDLAAVINNSGDITLTGSLGAMGPTLMTFAVDDLLNPSGIYGANPPVTLNLAPSPTALGNNVYGWIAGDLLSGLNIGAVGSSSTVGGGGIPTPVMIGAMKSSGWFTLSPAFFFSKMQPSQPYYNQWAATLAPVSQAYGFAYSDRFAHVLANLDPAKVNTLSIILEPDQITM